MREDLRPALVELISATSEDRWAAGWMIGIERLLHKEGGVWEILGREIGWPTGYMDLDARDNSEGVWVTWDEATAIFREEGEMPNTT